MEKPCVNTLHLPPERYLTTQHERDTETGYDNRGARLYDADVMRFLSVDPLAADYAAWSAYHYAANNPIIITDPTGREWSETNKELAEMYGVFGRGQGTDLDVLGLFEKGYPPVGHTEDSWCDENGCFNRVAPGSKYYNRTFEGKTTLWTHSNSEIANHYAMQGLGTVGFDGKHPESPMEAAKMVGSVYYNSLVLMSTFYSGAGAARGLYAGTTWGARLGEGYKLGLASADLYSAATGWEKPLALQWLSFGSGARSLASGKVDLGIFNDFNDVIGLPISKTYQYGLGLGQNWQRKLYFNYDLNYLKPHR